MSGAGLLLTASLILNALLLGALFLVRRRTRQQTIQLRRNTARLDDTEARLILALEGADLGFWVWDIPSGRMTINSRGLAMLGYRDGDIGDDAGRWRRLLHPDDEPRRQGALQSHWSGQTSRYECEYRLRHRDGHWVWILERGRIMHCGPDGRPVQMVATFLDISQRKAIEHELYQLATTDSLTGLPNRRVFMERLHQEWAHKQRSPALHTSVVLCDIDRFKTINNRYGHDSGDAVLHHFSRLLAEHRRANDLAARLGGEEFAVILQDAPAADAAAWAERLRAAVAQSPLVIGQGRQIRLTVSAGVAEMHAGQHSPEDCLKNADCALYDAKRQGRNRIATAPAA